MDEKILVCAICGGRVVCSDMEDGPKPFCTNCWERGEHILIVSKEF